MEESYNSIVELVVYHTLLVCRNKALNRWHYLFELKEKLSDFFCAPSFVVARRPWISKVFTLRC